jgi:hypothetical protein
VPPSPEAVRLNPTTPLRLKRHGRLVGARHLTAEDLVFTLCARLRLLAGHCGGGPAAFDWQWLHIGKGTVFGLGRYQLQRL